LKNLPIVDISLLVAGFLIRIMYGAIVTKTDISNWLYLTVLAMAFYLALGKRRNELSSQKRIGETRRVLKYYSHAFLNNTMYMCLTLANVFYALWSTDEKTMASYGHNYLVVTVPIVLIITMKYTMNIEGESDGDPVEVLLKDKTLLLLCLIYLSIMLVLIYCV
ncbi:prenyltransferase, partial [[Ruminococcus] torques]|nr:prenyltransferase [[Ruminococcus] torques]